MVSDTVVGIELMESTAEFSFSLLVFGSTTSDSEEERKTEIRVYFGLVFINDLVAIQRDHVPRYSESDRLGCVAMNLILPSAIWKSYLDLGCLFHCA